MQIVINTLCSYHSSLSESMPGINSLCYIPVDVCILYQAPDYTTEFQTFCSQVL